MMYKYIASCAYEPINVYYPIVHGECDVRMHNSSRGHIHHIRVAEVEQKPTDLVKIGRF